MPKHLTSTAVIVEPAPDAGVNRKFLRKASLKGRYPDLDERTLDKMVDDGRLPSPYYFGRRLPLWALDELEESERQAKAQTLVEPIRRAKISEPADSS